jgi:hypothetical protein
MIDMLNLVWSLLRGQEMHDDLVDCLYRYESTPITSADVMIAENAPTATNTR